MLYLALISLSLSLILSIFNDNFISIWFVEWYLLPLLNGDCVCLCRQAQAAWLMAAFTLYTCFYMTSVCVCFCVSAWVSVDECVCYRGILWSLLSQFITLQDCTTRCDSAWCSSASGAGILIDVKTTKYSDCWWLSWCTEMEPVKETE